MWADLEQSFDSKGINFALQGISEGERKSERTTIINTISSIRKKRTLVFGLHSGRCARGTMASLDALGL